MIQIPNRAVIYCRISSDREGAGLGVERQRGDCLELAAQLGVEVVETYSDNDLSAYSGKPRPRYQALLADLRAGHADTVLAWHTDRLHRSPAELEEYIDACEPRAIQTRTVKAGILDLSTATGRMIARQLGVQARYEVERMVERQQRKRDEMAQKGQFFGGRRPFGYESDGTMPRSVACLSCARDKPDDFVITISCTTCGKHNTQFNGWQCSACSASDGRHVWAYCRRCDAAATVLNASEFHLIQQASEAVLAGASLRSIAAEWNTSQPPILTSTGSDWEGPEVGSMLRRSRNGGILRHRGHEAGPAGWPAPLDEPTWRSLVALLDNPSRRTTPGNERKYLGSGIYQCGICRLTMRCSTSGTGAGTIHLPAYRCRSLKHITRRCDLLDDYITLIILERVSRPDAVDLLAQRDEEPIDVLGAQRDMRQARATLDALAEELGAGSMDMLEWRAASGAARKRLAAAEEVLSHAVKANPVAGLVGVDDPEAVWNRMDLSRRRAVLTYLMDVIVHPARRGRLPRGQKLDTDAIEIRWKS